MFAKYPSISQFRQVVKDIRNSAAYVGRNEDNTPIYDPDMKMPVLTFTGTVKLNGTNAAVCKTFNKAGESMWVQSRNRIITPENDNVGFAAYVKKHQDIFETMLNSVYKLHFDRNKDIQGDHTVYIFGEWCGEKIQSKVALNSLPRMFVIFDVKIASNDPLSCFLLKSMIITEAIV
jgi:hypothetical protein